MKMHWGDKTRYLWFMVYGILFYSLWVKGYRVMSKLWDCDRVYAESRKLRKTPPLIRQWQEPFHVFYSSNKIVLPQQSCIKHFLSDVSLSLIWDRLKLATVSPLGLLSVFHVRKKMTGSLWLFHLRKCTFWRTNKDTLVFVPMMRGS